ncbi:epimerase [Skermanella stibiiresistens SB22]|uniref:Epimerase n=1 Tax=Skermanella stibiiresistens SB22 TaxID=1385369 RepID=W9H952_9PROT|nr:SDR family oxidoreductase [Skermanella stibiiresistens]EWY40343.1 epimerase [Skermanella stibiiresistens SB22]
MQPPPTPRLFCFGLGFSPLAFIDLVQPEGWRVAGTTRGADKAAALAARGIETHLFDRGRPLHDPTAALAGTTHLLTAVPPDADGDPVLDHHAADIASLMPNLRWVGYLSTTGVYGDHGGAWVDETTPTEPTGRRQKQRLAAEEAWLRLWRERGVPVHLFRLAGIYGPGRSAIDSVRSGTARRIDKPGQVFSRIHVEDIARVLRASIDRPNPGAAYNLCDDNPAAGHEVTAFACELLGVQPPPLVPFDQAELSPMAASFYADNKKVRNDRIKSELGVTLKYPDYRPALRAQLDREGDETT